MVDMAKPWFNHDQRPGSSPVLDILGPLLKHGMTRYVNWNIATLGLDHGHKSLWNDHDMILFCGMILKWNGHSRFSSRTFHQDHRHIMVKAEFYNHSLTLIWQGYIWYTWSNHVPDMVKLQSFHSLINMSWIDHTMTIIWPCLNHGLTRYVKWNIAILRPIQAPHNLIWPSCVYDLWKWFWTLLVMARMIPDRFHRS